MNYYEKYDFFLAVIKRCTLMSYPAVRLRVKNYKSSIITRITPNSYKNVGKHELNNVV